jgi:hypothetical protein
MQNPGGRPASSPPPTLLAGTAGPSPADTALPEKAVRQHAPAPGRDNGDCNDNASDGGSEDENGDRDSHGGHESEHYDKTRRHVRQDLSDTADMMP